MSHNKSPAGRQREKRNHSKCKGESYYFIVVCLGMGGATPVQGDLATYSPWNGLGKVGSARPDPALFCLGLLFP